MIQQFCEIYLSTADFIKLCHMSNWRWNCGHYKDEVYDKFHVRYQMRHNFNFFFFHLDQLIIWQPCSSFDIEILWTFLLIKFSELNKCNSCTYMHNYTWPNCHQINRQMERLWLTHTHRITYDRLQQWVQQWSPRYHIVYSWLMF
jgi:hypothetical protein